MRAPVQMDRVAESISRNFGHVFSRQMLWLESLDALVGKAETIGLPVRPPANLRRLRGDDDTFWA